MKSTFNKLVVIRCAEAIASGISTVDWAIETFELSEEELAALLEILKTLRIEESP